MYCRSNSVAPGSAADSFRRAAADIAVQQGGFRNIKAEPAHDVLAISCVAKSRRGLIADEEIDSIRGRSAPNRFAKAHDKLARCWD